MKKLPFALAFALLLALLAAPASAQTHFANCLTRQGGNAVVIVNASIQPNIDGVALQTGDEIAVLDPRGVCVGSQRWSGSNTGFTVWGVDQYSTTGLRPGEPLKFVVWDASAGKEFKTVAVSYKSADPLFAYDGRYSDDAVFILNTLNVVDQAQTQQTIALQKGWNMISSNVVPKQPALETIFAPIMSQVVLVRDDLGKVYLPTYNINQISAWNASLGYRVYTDNAAAVTLTGAPALPEQMQFSLRKGWNIVSYPRTSAMDPAEALRGLSGDAVVVKDNAGNVYLPEYNFNSMGQMKPGQGYMVYVAEPTNLVYPANSNAASKNANAEVAEAAPGRGLNYSASIIVNAPNLTEGAAVTAWSRDRQVGAGIVKDSVALVIVVGDDPETAATLEGARDGEALVLKLAAQNGAAQDLALTSVEDILTGSEVGRIVYTDNAAFYVHTAAGAAGSGSELPATFGLDQNYPNPFNPSTRIRYQLAEDGRVTLEVFNMLGQRVRTLVTENQRAGYYEVDFNAADLPSGSYVYRLQAGQQTMLKKMALVK